MTLIEGVVRMAQGDDTSAPAPLRPLVLVVDDYDDTRALYALYLAHVGYRVEEARDGAEALEKATRLLPAVILMDVSMPVLDGWEVTRRLKGDARTADVSVIALTGHGQPVDRARAVAVGCATHVVKPCEPERLAREVARILAAPAPAGARLRVDVDGDTREQRVAERERGVGKSQGSAAMR